MNLLNRWRKGIQAAYSQIHLVDRCLLVFMFVLLAQSAFSLFSRGAAGAEINNIDVIVRTSTAAIFGYFLSANFIRNTAPNASQTKKSLADEAVKSESLDMQGEPYLMTDEEPAIIETEAEGRLQILVAAGIGMFCLISLLLLRNVSQWSHHLGSSAISPTIVQFRDFVSGCVGFLISCPSNFSKKSKD